MFLESHPVLCSDFTVCAALFGRRPACDVVLQANLPKVWNAVLARRALYMTVFEDKKASRIVGFMNFVFVTPDFLEQARRNTDVTADRLLVDAVLSGSSPILGHQAVRAANTDGTLHLFGWHTYFDVTAYNKADLPRFWDQVMQTAVFTVRGYHFASLSGQMWGTRETNLNTNAGYEVWNDYSDYYARHGIDWPEESERPFLVGVTRAAAEEKAGSYISTAFVHQSPVAEFSPGEQDVLLSALQGRGDAETAAILCLSLETVRTRWRLLFRRAEDCLPDVLPSRKAGAAGRGSEKRTVLLHYLRQHPEELRPVRRSTFSSH